MRIRIPAVLAAGAVLFAAACGGDGPTRHTGPVTVLFDTEVYRHVSGTRDTVHGIAILDGSDTIQIPRDSFVEVSRGEHTIEWKLDIDYLPASQEITINPNSSRMIIPVPAPETCHYVTTDQGLCANNVVQFSGSRRLICPVNDYGEFCSYFGSPFTKGLIWPAGGGVANEYVGHAKLLIGGTMGPGSPAGTLGDTLAMAFYIEGDYSTRTRLHPLAGDSSRWQSEVWTDVRHVPVFPSETPRLPDDDRKADNFGLSVRSTYHIPPGLQDAILIRFDVSNISTHPDYRRVNPEEPVGGHTLTNIYLAPVIDPAIGGAPPHTEGNDDNTTVFPADSLLVAYDQSFNVADFGGGDNVRPALVGVRLVSGPPSTTARAILFDRTEVPEYEGAVLFERPAYRLLAAGRAGPRAGCSAAQDAVFLCSPETPHDAFMGWSVGPLSLAPGQSTTLVIAIVLAYPKAGTFTSGTAVAPANADVTSTGRAIYNIAEPLRALADEALAFGGFGAEPAIP